MLQTRSHKSKRSEPRSVLRMEVVHTDRRSPITQTHTFDLVTCFAVCFFLFYLRLAIQKSFAQQRTQKRAHMHSMQKKKNCVDFNICVMQINISHLQRRMRASKRRKKTKCDFAAINRSKALEKEHGNILVAAAVVWCRFKKFIFDASRLNNDITFTNSKSNSECSLMY